VRIGSYSTGNISALLLALVAALFVCALPAVGQRRIDDMPPPPQPPRLRPKPTPTPVPPKPGDEEADIVRVSSNLVMVPVSVVDRQGQPVRGLQLPDFRLDEDGRQQRITEIGNPDQVPLDIALLFDVSSSVSQKGFFVFQQTAAAAFLKQVLKPIDRAAIFTIGQEPEMIQELAPAETAAAKLMTIPPATSAVPTAFYDTVNAAAQYLTKNSGERHRRVIVVITDGDDNFSHYIKDLSIAEARASETGQMTPAAILAGLQERHRRAVRDVESQVQRADITFYSINPGGPSVQLNRISMRAQNGMAAIAAATGGAAFLPDGEKELEPVLTQVAAELRGQYLLLYYSDSKTPSADFRRIEVGVPAHQDLRVRARQGYYPKSK